MRLLFPCHPPERKRVEDEYAEERAAAGASQRTWCRRQTERSGLSSSATVKVSDRKRWSAEQLLAILTG